MRSCGSASGSHGYGAYILPGFMQRRSRARPLTFQCNVYAFQPPVAESPTQLRPPCVSFAAWR